MQFLTLIGIFLCPIFTFGCVLIHYDHPILGIIAIIVSMFGDSSIFSTFRNSSNDDKK